MIWAFLGVYLLGFVITHTLLKRHWYREFGVEYTGFVWAATGAAMWPVMLVFAAPLALLYGVFLFDRRRA